MLTNNYAVEGEHNVVIGTDFVACHNCAMEWASENKKTAVEGYNAVRGKCEGEKMKIFPALRDINGDRVYLCKDCVEKFAGELSR